MKIIATTHTGVTTSAAHVDSLTAQSLHRMLEGEHIVFESFAREFED